MISEKVISVSGGLVIGSLKKLTTDYADCAFLRLGKTKTPPLAKKRERAEHLADGRNAAGVDYNPRRLAADSLNAEPLQRLSGRESDCALRSAFSAARVSPIARNNPA